MISTQDQQFYRGCCGARRYARGTPLGDLGGLSQNIKMKRFEQRRTGYGENWDLSIKNKDLTDLNIKPCVAS
jgi:hypothetical protein